VEQEQASYDSKVRRCVGYLFVPCHVTHSPDIASPSVTAMVDDGARYSSMPSLKGGHIPCKETGTSWRKEWENRWSNWS
jgi:hypothetical protein